MTVATALVSGNEAQPWLAEQAVREALHKSGLAHASGVLLFLTPEFARHAQHTVTAVARTAQCTQVAGGIASGIFTEDGWTVDRPAVAVMVFGGGLSLAHPESVGGLAPTLLSYAGSHFPPEWHRTGRRFGGTFSGSFSGAVSNAATHPEPLVWQQSRLNEQQGCSVQLLGAHIDIALSCGLKLLGKPHRVEQSSGFDLERLGGQPAFDSLMQALPPELREGLPQHLHPLAAVVLDPGSEPGAAIAGGYYRPIALIAANPDNSLTLAEHVEPGQQLCWAIRQPDSAETDMRNALDRLLASRNIQPAPACALMFSCIGRGPYFYGGDDRDRKLLCQRFPGLPVLGTYSTGQIAPSNCSGGVGNHLLQNSVVTALVSPDSKEAHVQSIP